jgi:hypothetical protein
MRPKLLGRLLNYGRARSRPGVRGVKVVELAQDAKRAMTIGVVLSGEREGDGELGILLRLAHQEKERLWHGVKFFDHFSDGIDVISVVNQSREVDQDQLHLIGAASLEAQAALREDLVILLLYGRGLRFGDLLAHASRVQLPLEAISRKKPDAFFWPVRQRTVMGMRVQVPDFTGNETPVSASSRDDLPED